MTITTTTGTTAQPGAEELAAELAAAAHTRVGVEPLSARFPGLTLDTAYAVQLAGVRARLVAGDRVVGHKVGLTSRAMQEQLGVTAPDLGHLFDRDLQDTAVAPAVLRLPEFVAPRVEPEIGFVLARALQGPGVTAADVLAATGEVVAALEIIDSRVLDWRIGLLDTVADNASGAGTVLGASRLPAAGVDLPAVEVTLAVDGEVVAAGSGGDVLGNPAEAVAWLANALAELDGSGLQAGHVVLPGSCTRAVSLAAGQTATASFSQGLGSVSVTAV